VSSDGEGTEDERKAVEDDAKEDLELNDETAGQVGGGLISTLTSNGGGVGSEQPRVQT
jgi:hypothetical protein